MAPLLHKAITDLLEARNVLRLAVEEQQDYWEILKKLAIPENSAIASFFTCFDDIEYSGEIYQLINICWFYANTSDYEALLHTLWYQRPGGTLSKNFVPISFFQGEKILLYNTEAGTVYFVNEAEITRISSGDFTPQWADFNLFLLWFFGLPIG